MNDICPLESLYFLVSFLFVLYNVLQLINNVFPIKWKMFVIETFLST
jgi:hypothetical protein